jgi:hypothetical protein
MQSSLGATIHLDLGLQRRTRTNHTILALGSTGKAETIVDGVQSAGH